MRTIKRAMIIVLMTAAAVIQSNDALAGCGNLLINISSASLISLRVCGVFPIKGNVLATMDYKVIIQQEDFYGPEVVVDFKTSAGDTISYRFQQNFCLLKPGKITVEKTYGEQALKYTVTEGSYDVKRNGSVEITGFE